MMGKALLCCIGMCLFYYSGFCQSKKTDLELLRGEGAAPATSAYYSRPGNSTKMLEVHHSSAFARYNPLSLLLKGTMYTYQHVISPQLSRSCPYEITCSNFSKQSIQEYGIIKGVFISADRILRCNRIGILDVHPLDFNDLNGTIADSPKKYQ